MNLDWYDYGFRFYDPALARFVCSDPIADQFPHVSPYNYAENRPIDGVDLWGLQWVGFGALGVDASQARRRDSDGFSGNDYMRGVAKSAPTVLSIAAGATPLDALVDIVEGFSAAKSGNWVEAGLSALAVFGFDFIKDGKNIANAVDGSSGLKKYEVGDFDALGRKQEIGDGLDRHHVPQSKPASQSIEGYDPKTAPAMAIPADQHKAIPTKKGDYIGTARDQLAKDASDLRNTGVPNENVQEIIRINKEKYPDAYKK